MAKKGNIRSMRFSDEILEIIESQPGETFTAKFETLVTRCIKELPRKEQELEFIQQQISQEKKRLDRIRSYANKLQHNIQNMEYTVNTYKAQMQRATDGLEAMLKDV